MKRILALTAAFLMALSMAACGDTDKDEDEKESKAPKATAADASTEEKSDSKEAESEEAESEEETESPADIDEEPEESSAAELPPLGENDFAGSCYRITVDPNKWSDAGSQNGVDAMYMNTADMTTNFNVVATPSSGAKVSDLAAYGDVLKQTYESYGYTVNTIIPKQYNGRDVLYAEIQMDLGDAVMKQVQYYFVAQSDFVIFTYSATDQTFDTYLSDFTAVLDSIVLI
ncbi:MAG: hypothetical protein IJ746_07355 [Ruminococcus sp.]|nr:hypothetical protein [Ruminococcus sp.]